MTIQRTKKVLNIFSNKYPCNVNDISRNYTIRYFCGTSDISITASSSDASKTSAFVTRLSSYFNGVAPQIYIFL